MPVNPKDHKYYTWKEFFQAWKKGMQEVTPLQQTVTTQYGQIVSLIGIIWGIIFSIRLGYWWMAVILIGGVIVLGVQMLGNWQKKVILKNMDKLMRQAEPSGITDVIIETDEKEVQDGFSKLVG